MESDTAEHPQPFVAIPARSGELIRRFGDGVWKVGLENIALRVHPQLERGLL